MHGLAVFHATSDETDIGCQDVCQASCHDSSGHLAFVAGPAILVQNIAAGLAFVKAPGQVHRVMPVETAGLQVHPRLARYCERITERVPASRLAITSHKTRELDIWSALRSGRQESPGK